MVKVAPSILNCDFLNLKEEILQLEEAGVDLFHIDVTDGNFVPNISFGFPILEAVKRATHVPLDVHLMIQNPDAYVEEFLRYSLEYLTVHIEAAQNIKNIIYTVRKAGCKVGVAISPSTSLETIKEILPEVDMVLCMTIEPGFGGQSFIPEMLLKIKLLDTIRKEKGYKFEIQVDGGINTSTGALCKEAGVDILVAGTYLIKSTNKAEAVEKLKNV